MRFLISTEQDRTRAREHLSILKLDGVRRFIYDVKQYRRPRSTQQNRTLWMWYAVVAAETGTPSEDVHEWCKRRFLDARTITVAGETIKIPGSTRTLDTKQFCAYMDHVQQWARDELSIVLPDPSMVGYDEMVVQYGK